ncbi:MAG: D-amino acid aminotransferase [Gammaproteobacteria bacterium]|nr:D-amino acid aminotransferase [Gammaproteobacteria bacterium]
MNDDNVYLNGEFLPLQEARISVMDRGFLFGDSIYEVIPAYTGRLFRLPHHLERLGNSLQGIRMQNPMSDGEWSSILERLVAQNPQQDQSVYLQVTRGAAEQRDHTIPDALDATVFAMASPMHDPDPALARDGTSAITLDDIRWRLCNIKSTALLANVLLKQQAKDSDAIESILIRDGNAMEGAASNLFIVSAGELITPPKSNFLLPGITRDLILELAVKHGLTHSERSITEAELRSADEIWLTSSTKEIMPVTTLDHTSVGSGTPGPVYQQMSQLYADYKERIKQGLEQ